MGGQISDKSEMTRMDAACGLAILLREICEKVTIASFSNQCVTVPPRHGFALRDAVVRSQEHSGTCTGAAIEQINDKWLPYSRIIVITDEQSHDSIPGPAGKGYVINVAPYKNGIGYGKWTHVDGFSEAVISYILAVEGEGK
jgi:hypothetical protein